MVKFERDSCYLILVRHGQTQYNIEQIFQGQYDSDLNELGYKQAEESCNKVIEIFSNNLFFLDQKYEIVAKSSDLKRAKITAEKISNEFLKKFNCNLNFQFLKELREYHAGDLVGFKLNEYQKKFPLKIEKYVKEKKEDPYNAKYPGEEAESWNMVSNRLLPILKSINNKNINKDTSNIFLYSLHGGVIKNILELFFVSNFNLIDIGNGDIFILKRTKEINIKFKNTFLSCLNIKWDLIEHIKIGNSISAISNFKESIL